MKKYVYSEAKQVVVGVLISLFRFCPPFVHKNIFLLVGGHFSKSLQHLNSDSLFTINARETGIYFNRQMLAKNKAKISKFIAVLPKSGFIAAPEDCLRHSQVFICRMR